MERNINYGSSSNNHSKTFIHFMNICALVRHQNLLRTLWEHFPSQGIELQQVFTTRMINFIQANRSTKVANNKRFAFRLRNNATPEIDLFFLDKTFVLKDAGLDPQEHIHTIAHLHYEPFIDCECICLAELLYIFWLSCRNTLTVFCFVYYNYFDCLSTC